jgi:23S rRNA (uracil1939-C5)-methyltransferase
MQKPRPQPLTPTGEPIPLTIHHMGGEGEGGARGPDGRVIHVGLTLPGEEITARMAGDRAVLDQIIKPSPERVEPPCPNFGTCGGCALQHWDTGAYLDWKVEHLRQTLAHERIETEFLPAFMAKPGSRRRVTLHARHGTEKGQILLGFKARRAWDVVDIEECSIAHPRLVAALPSLRRLARPFLEHPKSAPSLHVTVTGTGLDVDVTGIEAKGGGLSADARRKIADLAREFDFARVTLAGETLYQARMPVVQFGQGRVELPAGGFLQASADAEKIMAADAVEALAGSKRIADLFCGSGAFSFPLATLGTVLAVDGSEPAINALRAGIATAPGLKTITPLARDLFRRPLSDKDLKGIDGILFDPPRAGAAEQAACIGQSKASKVVGVSCNPATFARDASLLIAKGFKLVRLRPVDQFLWSSHIELVGVFER